MFFSKKKANSKKNAVDAKKAAVAKETARSKTVGTTEKKEAEKARVTPQKVETAKVAETPKVDEAKIVEITKATDKNENLTKAEKLRKYFQKKKMEMFAVEEVKDASGTAVFRASMEIGNTLLPMAILLDNSAYVLIQVELMPKFIKNDEHFDNFAKSLNALNNAVRPFKFAISGKGDFMLNMILTFPNSQFDPALCHAFVVEIMKYLDKDYKDLVNACLKVRDK